MANQPIAYDPTIIQEFAQRLYRKAASTIALFTILGILVGFFAGAWLMASSHHADGSGTLVLIAVVIGAMVGYFIGSERAFWLKLKAQQALCSVKIEENTRRASA